LVTRCFVQLIVSGAGFFLGRRNTFFEIGVVTLLHYTPLAFSDPTDDIFWHTLVPFCTTWHVIILIRFLVVAGARGLLLPERIVGVFWYLKRASWFLPSLFSPP